MENTLTFLLMLMRNNAGFERCGRRQLSTESRKTSIEDEMLFRTTSEILKKARRSKMKQGGGRD
jgi:hypothetical protein